VKKTADWIWMPFGVVSGVGRVMGVVDGRRSLKRRAVLGVNVGHPITNGDFVAQLLSAVRIGDAAVPKYVGISCLTIHPLSARVL